MKTRMNYRQANPGALATMFQLEKFINSPGLDKTLIELIKLRVSQLNGCAYCVAMHAKDLRKLGVEEEHIDLLPVWREAPVYTEAERAALALAEAVTHISEAGVPDDLYEQVRVHYDETQFVTLIMVINTINSWNRIAISTGMFPGCDRDW
jgi:AhpD family alkylhydroperoxidase